MKDKSEFEKVFKKLKKEIRQNWEWNLSQDEDSEGDILIIKMKSLKPIIDQAQKEVENIYKRDVDNVAKMLLNKGGKKYKSCTAPRGQYCKKHGVVHKEMKI